jgi:hypothetical protein
VTKDFGNKLLRLRLMRYGEYTFRAICPICREAVEPDEAIELDNVSGLINQPNAMCPSHGRVKMPFAGMFEPPVI